jgi:hypothetical protein
VLEGHTYEIGAVIGAWNLTEVYTVDGYVQTASATWWGWRRMSIGHTPRHAVDVYAWPTGGRELYVDGELIEPRAFAALWPRFLLGAVLLYGGIATFLGCQIAPIPLLILMEMLQ